MAEMLTESQGELAKCDEQIRKAWLKLRDDPKADPDQCRQEIDTWLDARLLVMSGKKAAKT